MMCRAHHAGVMQRQESDPNASCRRERVCEDRARLGVSIPTEAQARPVVNIRKNRTSNAHSPDRTRNSNPDVRPPMLLLWAPHESWLYRRSRKWAREEATSMQSTHPPPILQADRSLRKSSKLSVRSLVSVRRFRATASLWLRTIIRPPTNPPPSPFEARINDR